jgi:hypothetical protein
MYSQLPSTLLGQPFGLGLSLHITIHLIHHLFIFHVLQTMDNTLGFNALVVARINNLVVKDLIRKLVDI